MQRSALILACTATFVTKGLLVISLAHPIHGCVYGIVLFQSSLTLNLKIPVRPLLMRDSKAFRML